MEIFNRIKNYLWYTNHPLVMIFYIGLNIVFFWFFHEFLYEPYKTKIDTTVFYFIYFLNLSSLYIYYKTLKTNPGILTSSNVELEIRE